MRPEDTERAAQIADVVVTEIASANFPGFAPQDAGPLKVMIDQRLHAAMALRRLNDFSPEELEMARQFIASMKPEDGSQEEIFDTVDRALSFQTQLAAFSGADEALIRKSLEGSGVTYAESPSLKVAHCLDTLGYMPANIRGQRFNLDYLTDQRGIGVLKPRPDLISKGWFGWENRDKQKPIHIGNILLQKPESPWSFQVFGRDSVIEATYVAKVLQERLDHKIDIRLHQEAIKVVGRTWGNDVPSYW